jgi:hypothetical protein
MVKKRMTQQRTVPAPAARSSNVRIALLFRHSATYWMTFSHPKDRRTTAPPVERNPAMGKKRNSEAWLQLLLMSSLTRRPETLVARCPTLPRPMFLPVKSP